MKENTCNYSDEWQPYIGDYDKYEYDIKLKDGTIVENCYPNAGAFHSISDNHNGQSFAKSLVSEIRFSQKQRYMINPDEITNAPIDEEYFNRESSENKKVATIGKGNTGKLLGILAAGVAMYTDTMTITNSYSGLDVPYIRASKYKEVPVRTEPKIPRNAVCPKCDSGLKYKKCCINKN
jgi:hypothetical protein